MDLSWLVPIGLLAGICGGLLGIGGSIVMIPAMTELLGPNQHLYQAAALIVNFFVAAPAVVQHKRASAIQNSLIAKLIPTACVSAVGGVLLSELSIFRGIGSLYLTALFGIFLFYVAGYELRRLVRKELGGKKRNNSKSPEIIRPLGWSGVLAIAIPTGFLSGFLGVGGGLLAVPLQRRLLNIPLRNAIANSAAMIVGLGIIGALVKHVAIIRFHPEYAWDEPASLAVFLIPTAIIGSSIGSKLVHLLPISIVRAMFAAMLLIAGTRMLSMSL